VIYQWKDGAHVRGRLEAQQVGERLETIRNSGDLLTAPRVVEDARPEDALLHSVFEWDDSVAAEEFRREQARMLLRSVVAIPESAPESPAIRAFVVVSEVGEQSYVPTYFAMSDEQLRAQVVARALVELRQFQARYRELNELADIFAAINRVSTAA
jgi:hypothetical protein